MRATSTTRPYKSQMMPEGSEIYTHRKIFFKLGFFTGAEFRDGPGCEFALGDNSDSQEPIDCRG